MTLFSHRYRAHHDSHPLELSLVNLATKIISTYIRMSTPLMVSSGAVRPLPPLSPSPFTDTTAYIPYINITLYWMQFHISSNTALDCNSKNDVSTQYLNDYD